MNKTQDLADKILNEVGEVLAQVEEHRVQALVQLILQAPRIFIAGKGRSGLQMRAFAMRLMHLDLPVWVVDDVTTPGIGEGDLLLIGSGSGRTASLIQYAERCKGLNAQIGLITITDSSPIAERADVIVRLPAPTPKLEAPEGSASIQPMGTLFEQALGVLLDVLILHLMDEMGIDAQQMYTRHANLE